MANYFKMSNDLYTLIDEYQKNIKKYINNDLSFISARTIYEDSNRVMWIGSNDDGIFFFTTDGKYIEWNGTYLYSDILSSDSLV